MAMEAQEEHKQELRGQQSQEAAVPRHFSKSDGKSTQPGGMDSEVGFRKNSVFVRGRDSESPPSAPSIGWLTPQTPTS